MSDQTCCVTGLGCTCQLCPQTMCTHTRLLSLGGSFVPQGSSLHAEENHETPATHLGAAHKQAREAMHKVGESAWPGQPGHSVVLSWLCAAASVPTELCYPSHAATSAREAYWNRWQNWVQFKIWILIWGQGTWPQSMLLCTLGTFRTLCFSKWMILMSSNLPKLAC